MFKHACAFMCALIVLFSASAALAQPIITGAELFKPNADTPVRVRVHFDEPVVDDLILKVYAYPVNAGDDSEELFMGELTLHGVDGVTSRTLALDYRMFEPGTYKLVIGKGNCRCGSMGDLAVRIERRPNTPDPDGSIVELGHCGCDCHDDPDWDFNGDCHTDLDEAVVGATVTTVVYLGAYAIASAVEDCSLVGAPAGGSSMFWLVLAGVTGIALVRRRTALTV